MDSGDKYELFHKDFLCLYAYLLLESKKIVFVGFVLVEHFSFFAAKFSPF